MKSEEDIRFMIAEFEANTKDALRTEDHEEAAESAIAAEALKWVLGESQRLDQLFCDLKAHVSTQQRWKNQ